MSTDTITAPTDAQLSYIADLCAKNGHPAPAAIYSSREASEIITALRTGNYDPSRYVPDADLPDVLRGWRGSSIRCERCNRDWRDWIAPEDDPDDGDKHDDEQARGELFQAAADALKLSVMFGGRRA